MIDFMLNFRVSRDSKTSENVSLDLCFVNSSLQLLKEQLAGLNRSVEIYQDREKEVLPMIPLGLKETRELDLREPFRDFIEYHYFEDFRDYEETITQFIDL